MASAIEKRIGGLIRKQFPDRKILRNIRPVWLTSALGERMELDFYLPEINLAFEVQGAQHYRYVPFFHQNPEDFDKQLSRDRSKRQLCQTHGVYLIEVASEYEYEAAQSQILEAIQKAERLRLHDYLLQRCAQTIINVIALKQKLQSIHVNDRSRWMRTARSLEENYELMRYISIRTIQDFYNIAPFSAPSQARSTKRIIRTAFTLFRIEARP